MKQRISPFTVILSFLCLALIGISLAPLLPVKLNPSRVLPGFTIQFSLPGNSARVVEAEATGKLEPMLARIKGIKNIYSNSGNGWGNITIELDKHADVDAARFEASTIIRQTWSQLPDGMSYPYIQMKMPDDNASQAFMSFTLNAPASPIVIQKYAEEHIKPLLAQLPGIYRTDVTGATPMEWRLEYDSEELATLGITTDAICSAIKRQYGRDYLGTGDVEGVSGAKRWIRLALVPARGRSAFDASAIRVASSGGKLIRLDQLVRVDHAEEAPQSYYRINGLNSIYLSVTANETANQLELSKRVKNEIARVAQGLPAGYEIHVSYDSTEYIHNELDKIYLRTGLTIAILLLFVFIISLNWRYLALIVISLAADIAVAVIFYYLSGLEIQLYSLVGITVSFNLVIDNIIVMTDHILHRRNMKAYIAVLAATLTTMSSLVIVFFMDERIRLNLQDFAAVVIINLAVSLLVTLFLVPALIDKTGLVKRKKEPALKHLAVRVSVYYASLIRFLCRWRVAVCLLFVLAFGLPVFMLPEKLDGKGPAARLYNETLGAPRYREEIKPFVDKILGGSLRLFVQKVYEGSYFTRNEEVVLSINANLPNGSTLAQMNNLVRRMEILLSRYKEIKQFQTSVYGPMRAAITVNFKKEYQRSGFPYLLKSQVIAKALEWGGGSWSVYGLEDQGFSNDVQESAGSFRVKLYGYNYDELYGYAEKLKQKLLQHRRIKEVLINSELSWWKDDYREFFLALDKQRLAEENIPAASLFAALRPVSGKNMDAGILVTDNGAEQIRLSSLQSQQYDIWAMRNQPYVQNGKQYKLGELAAIEKTQAPQTVAKENQQYRLCLQYEYIGSVQQGNNLLEKDLEEFNAQLPMGYTAQNEAYSYNWDTKDRSQYLLLLVIIAIIFVLSSILFNSLKQPLAIIFVIPVSYIGVFLTFFGFKLNFDQGGFAAFVLLCGITVNASIYLLNEYNSIRRKRPGLSPLQAYIKAWNAKVIPILLTVTSTVLGFIPFLVGTEKESFWFPLAAGTIGGLIMSVAGVFLLLPVFTVKPHLR